MATTGHESEAINVAGLKASLQKLKTDHIDAKADELSSEINEKVGKTIDKTYAQMVALRDNSQLIPGQWYRITDYQTTTVQAATQSAGHQFDIIVRADDVNVLNENAYAAKHSGDTYFTNAGAKLEAWELKYYLDNDTNKFAWADDTNGKGVIYWMKDEWDNECPYDFKNIQFKRYMTSDTKSRDSINGKYMIADADDVLQDLEADSSDFIWAYTFSSDASGGSQKDTSLQSSVHDNVFRKNGDIIPNNVIFGYNTYANSFGCYCYNNSIGNGFNSNTIGNECYNNSIGNECFDNSIGNSCFRNSIGNSCYRNSIGNYFQSNSIGNYFQSNSIGNSCNNIRIQKNYVYYIIIENGNKYIDVTSTKTTSRSNVLRNFTIAQGVNNTTRKTISHNTVNDTFQTIYKPANSVEVSV